MNDGEDWSKMTSKGGNGMSKWHSQAGDAPFVSEDSGKDEIFGESGPSRSDLAACRRRIKFPWFARRP